MPDEASIEQYPHVPPEATGCGFQMVAPEIRIQNSGVSSSGIPV